MDDRKVELDDRFPGGRQNIYSPGDYHRFTPNEVARIVGLSPISIRLIHRQFHIGEKIEGRITFSSDDVSRIRERQNALHHHIEEERVNMSKRTIAPSYVDPTTFKLFDNNLRRIENIEKKMYDKADEFSYWNKFLDIQKTFNAVGDRLDRLEERLRELVKMLQAPPGGSRGRGASELAGTAPLTLIDHADRAA